MRRLVASALLVLGSVSWTAAARADDPALEQARVLFNKGLELFEKSDYVGAIEQFELADKSRHSPSITYNIARARESLGQAQAAHDAYEAYVSEAGAQGELLDAATVALARIKKRSTRVKVETAPAGATVRIDGTALREHAPAAVMVFRGRHRVEVELEGWVAGKDVDAAGDGGAVTVKLERPPPPRPVVVQAPPPPKKAREMSGVTFGLGWSLNYSVLVIKSKPTTGAQGELPADYEKSSLMFGATLEAGWAFTPKHAVLLRGNCGLGSDQKALFSLGSLSPILSYRVTPRWWIGGGAILASSEKNKGATYSSLVGADSDDSVRVSSTPAWGPVLELGLVLSDEDTGQWLLAMYPSLLLGTGEGQSTMYVPLAIGHRWY